ncbi:MAG: hypothetical protein NVS4B3_22030 [Gemmatimonadaceae bacterium]
MAAILLGLGTAAVYPTLLAEVADAVPPGERAPAVGTYRLWRDLGYVAGALMAGGLADRVGLRAAIIASAGVTAVSGVIASVLLPSAQATSASPLTDMRRARLSRW